MRHLIDARTGRPFNQEAETFTVSTADVPLNKVEAFMAANNMSAAQLIKLATAVQKKQRPVEMLPPLQVPDTGTSA